MVMVHGNGYDLSFTHTRTYTLMHSHLCRCGFEDIVPKVWVEKVNAVIPGLGYHVRWFGLWMEVAEGISMENFLQKGLPSVVPRASVLDFFHNKLNKTRIVHGAIFDLLTSQVSRLPTV